MVLLTVMLLNLQYGLLFRVQLKDRFGKMDENDNKNNDVLIVYSSKDSEVALGVLLPCLESKYYYKCASRQLPENVNICKPFDNC